MKRKRLNFLIDWLQSKDRKPLVIRGARQVGKTWLIRELAKSQSRKLIELNFEKNPDLTSLFSSNHPKEIIRNISASSGETIEPENCLLFLDEIQAAPQLLEKLRWFSEDLPELPTIAAGSLLDFALAKHEFSMPVGRIGYMYLEPLSFEEFLEASNLSKLKEYLETYTFKTKIPEAIHNELLKRVREYLIIGGMPGAVSKWVREKDPASINRLHLDLITTYREDFSKYNGRLSIEYLEDILNSVPLQLGQKFVFKQANPSKGSNSLKQALELLIKARVCHQTMATSANGLPLKAESKPNFFKMILLDCGLCGASLGLSLSQISSISDLTAINNGSMTEQLVGQLLRTITPAYFPPSTYYWQRSEKSSTAEIDYVISHKDQVIPVEVKAGKTGSLKSLHQFMFQKKRELALRFNSDLPSICPVNVKISSNQSVSYKLISLPFYLIEQTHRLLELSDSSTEP